MLDEKTKQRFRDMSEAQLREKIRTGGMNPEKAQFAQSLLDDFERNPQQQHKKAELLAQEKTANSTWVIAVGTILLVILGGLTLFYK